MNVSSSSSPLANPILIGAVTILVAIVAVFLSYNANEGLPFVPTRSLTVDLPDGQNLVPQNEVREGGLRIGIVTDMEPIRIAGGRFGARLKLKLDADVPDIPADSKWAIRPRSSITLKYLELERGTAPRTVAENGRVGIEQANSPQELDRFLLMFDRPTRRGAQKNLLGASDALLGRSGDLNASIERFPEFLGRLAPVSRNLSAPQTGLRRLIEELGDAARIVAPIGRRNGEQFTDGATTFEAISRDEAALESSIAQTPPTLAVGERSMRGQRPFQSDLVGLSEDLEASSREVRAALQPINRTLGVGAPVQERSVDLSDRTGESLEALGELTTDPRTNTALRALTATTTTLNPTLRFIGPKITVCNTFNFFWTFNAEHLSERDATGTSQRVLSNSGDRQDNSLTTMGAVRPVNGEGLQPGGVPQHFHAQPYGRAVDAQGNADCEDAQRGYPRGPLRRNGDAEDNRRFNRLVNDPETPGNQGPVFDRLVDGKGVGLFRSRIPEGQTFAVRPETGPRIP